MSIRAYVSAQRLDEVVTVKRATRDGNGDVTSWATVVCTRAAVDGAKASGAERFVADGVRSVSGYTVWMRADVVERFSIAVDDRIEWKSRYLDIKDIPDQGLRGRMLALFCEAGINKG